MKTYKELTALFEKANNEFIRTNLDLFHFGVSERTLCGALMLCLHEILRQDQTYDDYYVDVEYNRRRDQIKKIMIYESREYLISCDLIVHSRGEQKQDNLIVLEMKKSDRPLSDINKDKDRLKALTNKSSDIKNKNDVKRLSEHRYGYALGVYYEIDYEQEVITIEYYRKGQFCKSNTIQVCSDFYRKRQK